MPDNSERIAEIREILASGASQVVVDGTTVVYDLASLRQELRQLTAEDAPQRKPRVSSFNLGNT